MTKLNFLTLIVTPSALVSVWKNEFQKIILINVLRLCMAHWGQHLSFKDLYTSYKTPHKIENDLRKNNIVVFTNKKSLDKYIMANMDYYYLL